MPVKTNLSIVIPTYNNKCADLVRQLHGQARLLADEGLHFEILVGDDGSTDDFLAANRVINTLSGCRYLERGFNSGRAAIRNFLAQEARYDWLLFLDADMLVVNDQFLRRYLEQPGDELVIDGGVCIPTDEHGQWSSNLRYLYERAAAGHYGADQRQKNPYHDFHTANFLISRQLMLRHPFDERFRRYGYEDVLLGKQLCQDRISIRHIDNPVGFSSFEPNDSFVGKTEEGLQTLHQFRHELRGYSRILTAAEGIHSGAVLAAIRLWHGLFGRLERRNLCGSHPNLSLFKLYKLGYYLTLTKKTKSL